VHARASRFPSFLAPDLKKMGRRLVSFGWRRCGLDVSGYLTNYFYYTGLAITSSQADLFCNVVDGWSMGLTRVCGRRRWWVPE
jgi:hypothetical protein